jgi:hypothetical protein
VKKPAMKMTLTGKTDTIRALSSLVVR